ncbi:MAG TPA: hypothetical protein VLC09_08825 [Polyangiaceae bacterium]|nr:hypothetical protein [Polyangiaceae bacterium]
MALRARSLALATVLLAVTGCRKKAPPSPEEQPLEEVPSPLPDPKPKLVGLERCHFGADEKALVLRATKGLADDELAAAEGSLLDLGPAIAWGAGFFAVSTLDGGATTQARVALTDGRGRAKEIELGVVHGQVDPPRLAAWGSQLLVALADSDSSGTILRVGRIDDPWGAAHIVWGPEVPEGRDPSAQFALARSGDAALLVWDEEVPKSAMSRLARLVFEPDSLRSRGGVRRWEGLGDVDGPLLLSRDGGNWLVYSRYEAAPSGAAADASDADSLGLTDDPWVELMAVALDERSEVVGRPLALGRHRLQALDGVSLPSGGFVLAVRTSATQNDPRTIQLLRVAADGSIVSETVRHDSLGIGSPVLLREGEGIWLAARAQDGGTLLGAVPTGGEVRLELERAFADKEPAVAGPAGFLLVEPRQRDLALRVARCSL